MSMFPPSSKSDEAEFAESTYERMTRKFKEEPAVPVGIAATCVALFAASVALRKGNQQSANKYFRWRVYAQGFTVLAMVAGSAWYGETRKENKIKKDAAEKIKAQAARDRWLNELEAYQIEVDQMKAKKEARQATRAQRT